MNKLPEFTEDEKSLWSVIEICFRQIKELKIRGDAEAIQEKVNLINSYLQSYITTTDKTKFGIPTSSVTTIKPNYTIE